MKMIKTCVIPDMPNDVYHHGDGISKSDLDKLHRSPAHFIASKNEQSAPTPAMIFGSALHAAVLEPEVFAQTYVRAPEESKVSKVGKAKWAEIEALGKIALKDDDMTAIVRMRESIYSNKIARYLVEKSVHEQSAFADIEGVQAKCRPDMWVPERSIIADLKTTKDASPAEFAKSIANFRYYVQDAWYREVWGRAAKVKVEGFVFVAIEKEPPYALAMYELPPEAVEQGWIEAMGDLERYKVALDSNSFTAYSPYIESIELPRWAQKL